MEIPPKAARELLQKILENPRKSSEILDDLLKQKTREIPEEVPVEFAGEILEKHL